MVHKERGFHESSINPTHPHVAPSKTWISLFLFRYRSRSAVEMIDSLDSSSPRKKGLSHHWRLTTVLSPSRQRSPRPSMVRPWIQFRWRHLIALDLIRFDPKTSQPRTHILHTILILKALSPILAGSLRWLLSGTYFSLVSNPSCLPTRVLLLLELPESPSRSLSLEAHMQVWLLL